MAAAWRREKKIKAKKRAPVGQGIALQPALHASEGMQAALNGTVPKHSAQAVSRKQLNKMVNEVCVWAANTMQYAIDNDGTTTLQCSVSSNCHVSSSLLKWMWVGDTSRQAQGSCSELAC